jgi:hypothetical protein
MIFNDSQKSTGDSEKAHVSGAKRCGHEKSREMAGSAKTP